MAAGFGAPAPPGWYPDPGGSGWPRYFDGATWTDAPPPPGLAGPPPGPFFGRPPWKGAQLGRPPAGPGALANPGRRLAAQLLDALVLLPVLAVLLTGTLLVVAPHVGPLFPTATSARPGAPVPVPGVVWLELTVVGCVFVTGLCMVAYQTVATACFGRTLGKAWLHIRPLRLDGGPVGWGPAFGRAALYWLFVDVAGWIGLLDPLWCCWDDKRQCIHDKAAGTIVVNDARDHPGGS